MERTVCVFRVVIVILLGVLLMSLFLKVFPNVFYRDKPAGLCEAILPDKPNWVSSLAIPDNAHYVMPLPMSVFEDITRAIVKIDPNTYTVVHPYYIEGYRRTAFFGFTDWFCITDTGQVTSTATLGHSDVGVNRKWVESLRVLLNKPRDL
tara:strand:+ start:638 stop:1087 length:450 start_codon:yes stop_codon:yes gene_type:complete